MTPKRKRIQDYILKVITMQDPSKHNTKLYEDFFAGLSDEDFANWMTLIETNPNAKLTLQVPAFEVVIKNADSLKTAEFLGVKVRERLRIWDPIGKRYCLTPESYFILRLHVRRLKQYLQDGMSVPDSDRRLNSLTDQVVKPDKGSAISFPQAQMIAEKGLINTLDEMMSMRGGDLEAYTRMKTEIEEEGESTSDVTEGTAGVKSVQTFRTYIDGMHLDINL